MTQPPMEADFSRVAFGWHDSPGITQEAVERRENGNRLGKQNQIKKPREALEMAAEVR